MPFYFINIDYIATTKTTKFNFWTTIVKPRKFYPSKFSMLTVYITIMPIPNFVDLWWSTQSAKLNQPCHQWLLGLLTIMFTQKAAALANNSSTVKAICKENLVKKLQLWRKSCICQIHFQYICEYWRVDE